MHTAPIDTPRDTEVAPSVAFSYEYVTIVEIRYGNFVRMVPLRVFGHAVGADIHTTISNPDGTDPDPHVLPGAAGNLRTMLLPRALATVGD